MLPWHGYCSIARIVVRTWNIGHMHRATVSPEVMPHNSSWWSHANTRKKRKEREYTWKCEPRDLFFHVSRLLCFFFASGARSSRVLKISKAHCAFVTSGRPYGRANRSRVFQIFHRDTNRLDWPGSRSARWEKQQLQPREITSPPHCYASRYVAACIQMLAHSTSGASSSLMRAGWRLLFARMYKCGGRAEHEVPPGGVKESNKREPGELHKVLSQHAATPGSRALRPSPWIPLGQNSNDSGYYRQRLSALFPRTFRLRRGREGSGRGEGKGRGCPAERRENEDNSRWPRRLRSFPSLNEVNREPLKTSVEVGRPESVHFKTPPARVTLASGAFALALAFAAATRRV